MRSSQALNAFRDTLSAFREDLQGSPGDLNRPPSRTLRAVVGLGHIVSDASPLLR
jgi:hypothetical protein